MVEMGLGGWVGGWLVFVKGMDCRIQSMDDAWLKVMPINYKNILKYDWTAEERVSIPYIGQIAKCGLTNQPAWSYS